MSVYLVPESLITTNLASISVYPVKSKFLLYFQTKTIRLFQSKLCNMLKKLHFSLSWRQKIEFGNDMILGFESAICQHKEYLVCIYFQKKVWQIGGLSFDQCALLVTKDSTKFPTSYYQLVSMLLSLLS